MFRGKISSTAGYLSQPTPMHHRTRGASIAMERPLSPFMFPTWYRFQITSVLSILHRLTGIALGPQGPFLLNRLVHFHAAIWHNLSPPLTIRDHTDFRCHSAKHSPQTGRISSAKSTYSLSK